MRRGVGGVGRRGPGVVGTVARTAVIAGTATAVSKGVSGSMDRRAEAQQQAVMDQQAQQDAMVQLQAQQAALAQQQQMLAAQAAAAQTAPKPGATTDDTITQLQKLAALQQQGILTPEEFAQQKARILGT